MTLEQIQKKKIRLLEQELDGHALINLGHIVEGMELKWNARLLRKLYLPSMEMMALIREQKTTS